MKFTLRFYIHFLVIVLLGWAKPSFSQSVPNTNVLPGYVFDIDVPAIKSTLTNAPKLTPENNVQNGVLIDLTMPDGNTQKFRAVESSMMHPDLATQFPEIKSYIAQSVKDPTVYARFNLSPLGFHAYILSKNGAVGIIPHRDLPGKYRSAYERDEEHQWTCEMVEDIESKIKEEAQAETNSCFVNGSQLRTYRLAVTCTGEYAFNYGETVAGALAAINNRLATLNLIFEQELSVHFNLIPNNNLLINTDSLTDPFPHPHKASDAMPKGAAYIHSIINTADYDIGHTFDEQICPPGFSCSGGGVAGLGALCSTNGDTKARGYTTFYFGTVGAEALHHEIGHQFNAPHSYNGIGESCNTNNHPLNTAYEIGSGSTIMSYQGICQSSNNIPSSGGSLDVFFHQSSLEIITSFITSGGGASCAATTPTGNNPPTSNANPNAMSYYLPIGTPFTLTGSGYDPDPNDVLTYSWGQNDEDGAGIRPTHGFIGNQAATHSAHPTPVFRSYPPSTSPERTIPALNFILNNDNVADFEALPLVTRTVAMRLTVRDNAMGGGGVACDGITLNFFDNDMGDVFEVTNLNAATTWVADGTSTATVTWDVAGTTNAPINCPNVDILLSTDGGQTFNYSIAMGTTNDGSHTFTIPSFSTTQARVKVQASNNIFFDINNTDITINTSCTAVGTNFTPSNDVTENAGSANLNLGLMANYGMVQSSFSGTVDVNDPVSQTTVEDNGNPGNCTSFNMSHYELQEFYVDASDNYSFTNTVSFGGLVVNLYKDAYDPNAPCNNWIASNVLGGGNQPMNNIPLVPATKYVLKFSGFDQTLNGAYQTDVTSAGSGQPYNGPVPPGGSFSYTYVIVNDATGNVVAFDPNSDLSNAATYPSGVFKVYGLSYETATNLNTYLNGSFSNLINALAALTFCGELSSNHICVTINNPAACNITGAGLANISCDDNGTPADPSDDKITFELNPVGTNLGTTYTVSGTTLTPSSANYGTSTLFTAGAGTAGNGNLTLTITDGTDPNCTYTFTVIDPGACSGQPTPCLSTVFNGSNSSDGNMFDVENLSSFPLEIVSFEVNAASVAGGGPGGSVTIEVYYTTMANTHVGNANNAGNWTLLGSTTITPNGAFIPTSVPIGGLVLAPGESKGLYVTTTGTGVLHSTSGSNTYSDTFFEIDCSSGTSNAYSFGATTASRIWNGTICYNISCAAVGGSISPTNSVTANAGDPSLNLALMPNSGTQQSSFSGTIDVGDPQSATTVEDNNSPGNCTNFNNSHYETFEFYVDGLDTYSFTTPVQFGGTVVSVFQGAYDPMAPCDNWIASNVLGGGGQPMNDVPLVPGVTYILKVSGFGAVNVGMYQVDITGANGGQTYNGPPPGGGNTSYTYAIVNDVTGNIVAFDPSSDLSNAANYPSGVFKVYGVSYETGENLNTYVNGTFANFEAAIMAGTVCASVSANSVMVTINSTGNCTLSTAGLTNVACNDNGTPADPSDDIITFDLNPTGINLGASYNVTGATLTPSSGNYSTATSFSTNTGAAGGGNLTLTITDINDPNCTIQVTVNDPGTCSGATCNLSNAGLSNIACDDNGTPADPSDDKITFDLNPTGANLSASYNVTGATLTPSSGNYGAATSFSTNAGAAGGGNLTLTITDANNPNCTIQVTVNDPGTCSSGGGGNAFVTKWMTTAANEMITIPTTGGGYNYTVDWGDGMMDMGVNGNATHTYATAGMYTVSITGTFPRIFFNGSAADKDKIISIESWGPIQWTNMTDAFRGCTNLGYNAIDAPDLSGVTSLKSMFKNCPAFNGNLNNWNMATITSMEGMFWGATTFNGNISSWNTTAVTNMKDMFQSATAFNQPLNGWNVANVTNMQMMFLFASSFNQPLNNWTPTSLVFANRMFEGATAFNSSLSGWTMPNVTNVGQMFRFANAFNQPIDSWTFGSVTHLNEMFRGATAFDQPLNSWNISTATSMEGVFWEATAFNQPLNNWNIGNVTTMKDMFRDADSFNQDISNWTPSSATTLERMFAGADVFNQPLDNWDISSVTNMVNMLNNCDMSIANYDATLIGWDAQTVQLNVTLGAVGLEYCAGETARDNLINNDGWTINGDAKNCSNPVSVSIAAMNTICGQDNGSATATASGGTPPYTYAWNNGGNTATITDLPAGTYTVTATDNVGATATAMTTIAASNQLTTFTAPSGSFSDGSGANNYLNNLDCHWLIQPPGVSSISLDFTAFDIENTYDYVRVYDGTSTANPLIGEFTGNSIPPTTTSSGGSMLVVFTTDHSIVFPGWDATYTSSTSTNTALELDGVDEFIDATATSSGLPQGAEARTVEAWVQTTQTTIGNIVSWGTRANQQRNSLAIRDRSVAFIGQVADVTGVIDIDDGAWHHVAFTYDGTTIKLFVDGVLDVSQALNNVNTVGQNLKIGNLPEPHNGEYFNGKVDEIRIWNIALSESEIAALFDDTFTDPTSPASCLVAYYKMNEGTGTTLNDLTGNGNTGTLTNMENADWVASGAGVSDQPALGCPATGAPFITKWMTAVANEMITIPTTGGGYNYTVDWGDGMVDMGVTGDATHTYAAAGMYTVSITGAFPRIFFDNGGDKDKIISIEQWGDIQWADMSFAFAGCNNLTYNAVDAPDLSGVTSLEGMFIQCFAFDGDLSNWDVSTIQNMGGMFFQAATFNGDVTTWNTTSATFTASMFEGATAFNQDISGWNMANVSIMSFMFADASAFNQNIGGWNTGLALDMGGMFAGASAFNQDISGWVTNNVTLMSGMFANATSFNQDISGWNTVNVTEMASMFEGATVFDQDLGGLNISSVIFMDFMLDNTAMSLANYDATLIGWDAQTVQPNVFVGALNLEYCAGETARDNLINNDGWTFNGDTKNCNAPLSVFIASMNTICGQDNGFATATATGGTGPYTFAWDNGGNTATIENLAAGTYTVTATDNTGTTATAMTTIAASMQLTNLTTPSGNFSDGSGINDYLNFLDCHWLIQPSNATSITLDFTFFNVETGFDFVRVYDGTSTADPLLGEYSGSTLPPSTTSSGGSMLVVFTTDYIVGWQGWDAVYTSQVPVCAINNGGLANIVCDDNGTPANAMDDRIVFDLNPTGISLGTSYTVSGVNLVSTTGNYGAATTFTTDPGLAGQGDLTITITDDNDPNCTLTLTVADPGVCSSQAGACSSTFFTGGNQAAGNMFDVENLSATDHIEITSFEINFAETNGAGPGFSGTIEVYYTTTANTHVGHENIPGDWTLLGSAVVTSNGTNAPTPLPVGGLTLSPGESKGLYITAIGNGGTGNGTLIYTNGTSTHNDGTLEIDLLNGTGNFYPFSSVFTPRQWNGTICYETTVPSCQTDLTVNGNPITADTYQASNSITSDGRVGNGTTVVFDATNEIFLNANFEVELGAVFEALTGAGCTPFAPTDEEVDEN